MKDFFGEYGTVILAGISSTIATGIIINLIFDPNSTLVKAISTFLEGWL